MTFFSGYTPETVLKGQLLTPRLLESEESVKWLWENQFAAVAADNPAFDCTRKHIFETMNLKWNVC